jgi:hypothetical protein
MSGGNILDLAPDRKTFENSGNVLTNITRSFSLFKQQFIKVGNNFLTVPFYCNASIGYGRGYNKILDDTFFNCVDDDRLRGIYRTLTWKSLTNNEDGVTLMPRTVINQSLGITLTRDQYNVMVNTLAISIKRYFKEGEKSLTLNDFMNTFKKGSKYFRKIISCWNPKYSLEKTKQVWTFLQLIDCHEINTVRLRNLHTGWSHPHYNSSIRVFLFKYYNNILGLNSRVSHFNADINEACTFCNIAGPLPAPKETFRHLFYDCAVVNKVLNEIWSLYVHNLALTKNIFFLSNYNEKEKYNCVLNCFLDVVRFHIWQAKLNKSLPTTQKIKSEVEYSLYTVLKLGYRRVDFNNCPIFQRGRDGHHPGRNRP